MSAAVLWDARLRWTNDQQPYFLYRPDRYGREQETTGLVTGYTPRKGARGVVSIEGQEVEVDFSADDDETAAGQLLAWSRP